MDVICSGVRCVYTCIHVYACDTENSLKLTCMCAPVYTSLGSLCVGEDLELRLCAYNLIDVLNVVYHITLCTLSQL